MLARERLRHVSELWRWGLDWQPADTWHLTSQLRVDYAVPWLPWLAWCAAIYRLRHTGSVPAKKNGWLYEAPVAVACKPQDQWPWRTESVRHGQCTVTARACRPCARLVATDASHLQEGLTVAVTAASRRGASCQRAVHGIQSPWFIWGRPWCHGSIPATWSCALMQEFRFWSTWYQVCWLQDSLDALVFFNN